MDAEGRLKPSPQPMTDGRRCAGQDAHPGFERDDGRAAISVCRSHRPAASRWSARTLGLTNAESGRPCIKPS